MIQDNRESGENPEQSRCCVSGAFFSRGAVTVKMGRRKMQGCESQKTCLFIWNYEACGVQALIKEYS